MRDPRLATSFARHAAAMAVAGLIAGCSSAGSGSAAPPVPVSAAPSAEAATSAAAPSAAAGGGAATIDATESEYKIDLGATTAAAGQVTFHIKNGGTMVHEFVVMQTDLAANKLPIASGAPEVDEDASVLKAVNEVEDIAVGSTADLTVNLPAGHYVVICNVPGHYQSGMHTDLTVGAAAAGAPAY
jgi:uncharacterized cupredoxin-like copper-binding protein